jgi:hypothetical protein
MLYDFALDILDLEESRYVYEILPERHRAGSIIVTSNRGLDDWLAAIADPLRAQKCHQRFTSNTYDLRRLLSPPAQTRARRSRWRQHGRCSSYLTYGSSLDHRSWGFSGGRFFGGLLQAMEQLSGQRSHNGAH